jgi:hypothetical protein
VTVDIALVLASGGIRGWLERWAPLPEWLVAIGTGALALATYALAKRARGEVDAIREELDVSRRTLHAVEEQAQTAQHQVGVAKDTLASTVRPVLVDVPLDWHQGNEIEASENEASSPAGVSGFRRWHVSVEPDARTDRVKIALPVRNVGAGLAFVSGGEARSGVDRAGRSPDNWAGGEVTSPIVPPGEVAWLFFILEIRTDEDALSELHDRGHFTVSVTYRDLAGNEWTSKLAVKYRRERDEGWFVAEVLVKVRGAEDDEGVTSGDRDAARLK